MSDAPAQKPTAESQTSSRPLSERDDRYGVVLGWRAEDLGKRIALRVQSVDADGGADQEIGETCYFLSKQQAAQLGDYLFGITGLTPPGRNKPRLLDRLFSK